MNKLQKSKDSKYKILIIVPRYNLTNKIDYNYKLPIGLGYILSVLKEANYDVDCINLNHFNGAINEIIYKILNKKSYDFVGVGNTSLGYLTTEIIINTIKKHKSNPRIILGGPIITPQPKLIFNNLNPDFGILGEGEETILELLKCLKEKKDLKRVNGIIYKNQNNEMVITKNREPKRDLDSIPYPDFEALGFEEQLKNLHTNQDHLSNSFDFPKSYPIICSRSCPYQCTFCYHDSKYRPRTIKNVMEELNFVVKKYKINIILLYDDCFAIDKKRLNEFCEGIKKLRKEISWDLIWMPQLTVNNLDENLIKMLKDAGCDTISYGFESMSQEVLRSMKKPITPEQINHALKLTLKNKIGLQANFIFGDVAETNATAKETLDYWIKNAKGQISLGFIQPYPGSQIYQHCLKKRLINDEIDFIKKLGTNEIVFNMTENMTDKEIFELRKKLIRLSIKHRKFIKPKIKKIKNKIYRVSVKCPFCHQTITYRNYFIDNIIYYNSIATCRNCKKRFFIVSSLRKLIIKNYYKFYNIMVKLKENYKETKDKIKKIKFKLLNT